MNFEWKKQRQFNEESIEKLEIGANFLRKWQEENLDFQLEKKGNSERPFEFDRHSHQS